MLCTDWEMGQSFREWSEKYGDKWQEAFRNKYEKEMIEKLELISLSAPFCSGHFELGASL